ncbi:BTB/POZ domain-containing protein NPY1-like [Andrographis paniculata]|uniref:BTB/POZ domain-containing protein NPY1-like n=1 Tax=Andrographis paniculata TaxID=175694 RepID=UPI0021E96281|nr:BTB/POZ domain-containing protein NPY1-like [Andrographis paniculata]XP_051151367.1 BTB/POZ domain-containing protein NPY1-like [Andrographis paniculata]XP_051151368.1 BTB/POZ domain-containing protein NPY1-like [Andrographis paniculata]
MKFMKLGSKPDTFQAEGSCVRYVSSDLPTDFIVIVGDVKFYLHKFPLLSKSNRMQTLIVPEVDNGTPANEILLPDFPGGPKAFEICAKFCYGVTVTLNPYNVVSVRCAAEYLEMTEEVDRGNLILKIDIFLNSSILRSWKDSIIVLQTAKPFLTWSENLKIVETCIDSIASKTLVHPSAVTWSYTCNRKSNHVVQTGTVLPVKTDSVPKDWWIEDICELEVDLYKRVMVALKSKGLMDGGVIGEALKAYAARWLPPKTILESMVSEDSIFRTKYLLETIVFLLPSDKGVECSCSFLLKLLRVAVLVEADDSLKDGVIKMVALKLDEASSSDLLIPARHPRTTVYDVDLVQRILDENRGSRIDSKCANLQKIAKVVDGYLAAISHDPNLSVSSFIKLARGIPDSARPVHDRLYAAIDVYLKEHPSLAKSERKRLCGLMDVKKFTTDMTMHVAQNELLPLRTVVQVLFFEQVRSTTAAAGREAAMASGHHNNEEKLKLPLPLMEKSKSLRGQVMINEKEEGSKGGQLLPLPLPLRSRRIFDRLWITGKGLENGGTRSSEMGMEMEIQVSRSPSCVMKSSASGSSSSRIRRHSVS